MEKVYDLHQHTHCVIMNIGKADIIETYIFSTSNRYFNFPDFDEVTLYSIYASIAYNKQRTEVSCLDGKYGKEGEDITVSKNLRDGLYSLFKKEKETWGEEDISLMKVISYYLPAAIQKTKEIMELETENFDLFHYAIVVPSEWEEEVRDDIIRPIFVQSGLISNEEDHQDKLLFFTDIEAICYKHYFERGQNTILCRLIPGVKEIIVKFDLIQTTTTLFNIPNAKLFPKVMKSSSVSVTTNNIKRRIKYFLRKNLFPVATADDDRVKKSLNPKLVPSDQDQIIEAILEGINSPGFPSLDEENREKTPKQHWVIIKEEWELNESQKKFIISLCPSIICAGIGTFLLDYMKDIISNNFTKSYSFLLFDGTYSDLSYSPESNITWLKYILEYNSRSLKFTVNPRVKVSGPNFILKGAGIGVFEAIQYSDMYCKPRIMSSVDLTTSSSVFINSKPDTIINLDISLGSTLLTCSLLDENGLIQQIFDHDYFIEDNVPPLGHFYTFSNTTTLNVKERFIPFAEKYLLGDLSDFTVDDDVSIKKDLLLEMKALLTKDLSNGEVLVLTDKKIYIEAFILMYMIYIKEEMLYKLPNQLISDQMNMRIGYAVSIEAMILNNTMESKDNLRDIIYASGLVPKDDNYKKLRIITQGERILPAIQKSLKLEELSLKSYFLLCQLHEDYVRLSLHQVVTAPSSEEKYQESIIVQDEILAIQNIYDSLCLNMWYSLLQDSSLIELCETHNTNNNSEIPDLFSSEIKTEFFMNLKGHISDNVLQNNLVLRNKNAVNLTSSCNCKVSLTTSDIIDISFTPVLQDIACTLSASLLNMELFGDYMNIDYLFSFIRFNNNPQLQYAFAKILEEEADDFNLELGIDTSCLVIPELFNQLSHSVITQRPFCYKDFKIGALQQVCSENYAASITQDEHLGGCPIYKSKITDTKTIKCDYDIAFPLLTKRDIMNNVRSNRKFYLRSYDKRTLTTFSMEVHRFKTMNYLENNETLSLDYNIHQHIDTANVVCGDIFKWIGVDIPVIVSIRYVSYTSSLQFSVKLVGAGAREEFAVDVVDIGEPLTLTRF